MMTQIDINKHLFEKLQNDFRNTESQIKFFNGLDYLEAMVKFFACLNIAVVKQN